MALKCFFSNVSVKRTKALKFWRKEWIRYKFFGALRNDLHLHVMCCFPTLSIWMLFKAILLKICIVFMKCWPKQHIYLYLLLLHNYTLFSNVRKRKNLCGNHFNFLKTKICMLFTENCAIFIKMLFIINIAFMNDIAVTAVTVMKIQQWN